MPSLEEEVEPQKSSSSLVKYLKNYEVIHVDIHDHKRTMSTEYNQTLASPSSARFKLRAFEEDMVVDLKVNNELFGSNYYEEIVEYQGGKRVSSVRNERADVVACHYQGTVLYRTGEKGQAAVSSCGHTGYSGVIWGKEKTFGIAPAHQHLSPKLLDEYLDRLKHTMSESKAVPTLSSLHLIYKSEDYVENEDASCGLSANDEHMVNVMRMLSDPGLLHQEHEHHDSDSADTAIGHHLQEILSAKTTQGKSFHTLAENTRWVELAVVNDAERYNRSQQNQVSVFTEALQIVNVVDQLYQNAAFDPPIRIILVAQYAFQTDPWKVFAHLTIGRGLKMSII